MEFLLLVGALAGLLCGAALMLRGGTLVGCLLIMLAGSCLGHPFFNLPGGPIPVTLDRLLVVALAVQYVVFRRLGWTTPKPLGKADVALAAFLLVLIVSTVTHDWQIRRNQPLSQLLFFYLLPAVVYCVARQTKIDARGAATVLGFFTLFGVYLSLTAIAEWRGAYGLVVPRYITSAQFVEFLGRARGPFLNPAGLGIFLGTCIAAAALWLPRFGRAGYLLAAAALLIGLLATYGTLTRSVWMSTTLVLLVVGVWLIPRAWWPMTIGAGLVAGMLLVATNWESVVTFKRDKHLEAGDTANSAKLRPILATVAWKMFLDRPLLGCGYGQYPGKSKPYLSDRTVELPLEKVRPFIQHNVILALLTEVGVIGVACFVAVLGYWLRDAWRLARDQKAPLWVRQIGVLLIAAVAAYLPNSMFHDVSLISMVNMLVFFLAGVTTSVSASRHMATATSSALQVDWSYRQPAGLQPVGTK